MSQPLPSPTGPDRSFRPCLACGRANPRDAGACAACGEPLRAIAGHTALEVPTAGQRFWSAVRRRRRELMVAAVFAGAVIALAVLGILLRPRGDREMAGPGARQDGPRSGVVAVPGAGIPGGGAEGPDASQASSDIVEAATGLAAPVGAGFRAAGFEPTILRVFAARDGGPEDTVLVAVRGVDRAALEAIVETSMRLFEELDGSEDDLPPLGILSLVLTDTAGIVHKHEIIRYDALRAQAEQTARESLLLSLTPMVYPESGDLAASGDEEAGEAEEASATEEGPEEDRPAAEALEAPPDVHASLRFVPEKKPVKVLQLLVASRFPDADVELVGEALVVEAPQRQLEAIRLYLEEVDAR